jgi:phosphohistidine phosphatase
MPGPYELYLIRHGVAEEQGDSWPDDTKRPLSEDGMNRLRKSARGLAALGVSFDVVLTSPLVRTKQTADIVAGAFDPRPPIVTADSLAPGGSVQAVLADLEKQSRWSGTSLGSASSQPSWPARVIRSSSKKAPSAASTSRRCLQPAPAPSAGS